MGQIIDGKAVSAKVKEEIRLETEKLKEQGIDRSCSGHRR